MLDHFLWLHPLLLPPSCRVSLDKGRCSQAHGDKRLAKLGAYWGGIPLADAVQLPGWSQCPSWQRRRVSSLTAYYQQDSPVCSLPVLPCYPVWLAVLPIDLGQKWTYLGCILLLDGKSGKAGPRSPYFVELEDAPPHCCSSSLGSLTIPTFFFIKFRNLFQLLLTLFPGLELYFMGKSRKNCI